MNGTAIFARSSRAGCCGGFERRLSRRKAAAQFAVGISTVINWVRRFRETGSILPGQMGGHKPKAIIGAHRAWRLFRIKENDFTLRGLVAELAERGLKVAYKTVWNFVHAEKRSFKKNRARQRARSPGRRAKARAMDRPGSTLPAWSSSARPGPRPIWRRFGDGRRGAKGSKQKSRMAIGKP